MTTAFTIFSRIIFTALLFASVSLHAKSIDYAALYEQVSDSVVTVNTQTISVTEAGVSLQPGVGSGILIEPTLILTAAHVIEGVDMISVRFKDGEEIIGRAVSTIEQTDAGLISLERSHPGVTPVTMGDSDNAKTGSNVFIIGAPYGIEQTLSVGILSGRMSRGTMNDGTEIEFLQTDTAINTGNSGGPMFNADGEVIGIVSFILSKSGGFDGVGYASAINSAHQSVMQSSGYVAGFDGLALSEQVQRALGVPQDALLVQHVVEGSLADEFGLMAGTIPAEIGGVSLRLGGDIIVGVSCHLCKVSSSNKRAVADSLSNDLTTTLTVLRDGETVVLSREELLPESATIAALSQAHPAVQ